MSASILIIDSDPNTLAAYREALATKSASWKVTTVETAAEALACVETSLPDIAVASLRLDQGQGLKLLSRIVDAAPLAHAFIVADESEKEQLAAAIEGGCHYLPNDCPADRLILEFQRCLAIDSWLQSPVVKDIFAERTEFETLPPNYLKIVSALNSPRASVGSIAEIISSDLALASKILETVNSSFYGFNEKVADIHQAVSVLGLATVRNIVLAVQVFDRVGHLPEHQVLVNELWHHSIAVAIAAKRICFHETKDSQAAEEAYSAGLLHDIGKLVLLSVAPEQYIEAQRLAREEETPAWKMELKELGCDHSEVGAYLLARWGMPDSLSEAAALHHRPANACTSSFTSLAAVHAANAIVRSRRNKAHPDANPSEEFLVEIGLTDKWEEWEAAATGEKRDESKKLSIKPKLVEKPKEEEANLTTTAAHAALSRAAEEAQAKQERDLHVKRFESGGKNTLLAFSAGIVCCLCCIYFLSTIEDAPAVTIPDENTDSDVPSIHSRKDLMDELLTFDEKSELNTIVPDANVIEEAAPPPPPFPEINLGAIFQRTTGAKAQINGRILGVGDKVGEATIKSIDRISITVEHYGRTKTFSLD